MTSETKPEGVRFGLERLVGWLPIASAPKDGTRIRVRRYMGESFGWVTGTSIWTPTLGGGWISRGDGVFGELGLAEPDEWLPLPPNSRLDGS